MHEVSVAVVIIGRNEGERLKRCLRSIPGDLPAVYVDSGSTDGSVEFARSLGITTVELDLHEGFTAARARNAGWRALAANGIEASFVQFVDGDCELMPGWIDAGRAALEREPQLAAVFGRCRERFPDKSIYNRMCDDEWNVPIGIVASCGGNAMFRMKSLREGGGYSDDLIAGEEPDLCLRLRREGWLIRRTDAEMVLHDAAILAFRNWWRRARRSGFAYAEHVRRHGFNSDPVWRRQVISIVVWGFVLPAGALAIVMRLFPNWLAVFTALALTSAVYLGQALRIARRKLTEGAPYKFAMQYGALIIIGKIAEFGGVWRCWATQLVRKRAELIEHKNQA